MDRHVAIIVHRASRASSVTFIREFAEKLIHPQRTKVVGFYTKRQCDKERSRG